jgi:putative ABC transport system ATP-binding protein
MRQRLICAACSKPLSDTDPILHLKDVRYRWPGRASFGLEVPNLTLQRAETVLLLGESGSGKSTLLSLICGTINAGSGRVCVAGTDIAALSAGQRDRFRAEQIGLIFQQFNLLPFATVQDNILLPLKFAPTIRKRLTDPTAEASRLCHD